MGKLLKRISKGLDSFNRYNKSQDQKRGNGRICSHCGKFNKSADKYDTCNYCGNDMD